ncbi:alkyl/aryl-sulfatase [Vibrio mediterranei]|uniref:Hydrolase n=1 Tax=Vibrio mediterranei TaxID=689 RepID=A0AAN1KPJ5_9VIBR|nr:alkyl sulfatase dimerization domain-containing protein [Vibrio mediterranei]ASI91651.1 hydrolase [Vibrio mediterranei]
MKQSTKTLFTLLPLTMVMAQALNAAPLDSYDFTANSKGATSYTAKANQEVYKQLDFNNKKAFEEVDRGFIAPLDNGGLIKGIADVPAMQFVQGKQAPDTVNPSLWRHSQLVNRGGLYEVLPNKIYQVRGNDVSNLTIIETDNGIILYDIEYSPETMKAAYKLYAKHRGNRPLKAIIISHSHTDHYGGIEGVIKSGLASEEDIASGKIPVYVPQGFVEHAVGENVLFGNIMSRRAVYQYGFLLPKNEKGITTAALGPLVAAGANGLPTTVHEITKQKESVTIDGLQFDFRLVPESEAPSEMVFEIPAWGAVSMAEDVNHLQHNIYTMRGAKTRDAGKWAKYINNAIVEWHDSAKVLFGPHTWPTWGNEEVIKYMKGQRDLYKAINDQTTRLANYGYRPRDIAKKIEIADPIMKQWNNRDYYGNFENNVIATYVNNLGWFDGNPVEIARHTDADTGKRYVESFGGEDVVIEKALDYYQQGDYAFTVQLLNNIESYNKDNKKANYLMADAFEQLGFQEETALNRNWYLTAAKELRNDNLLPQVVNSAGPDVIKAIPSDLMMDVFATRIVPQKSLDAGRIAFDFELNGESFGVEVENGVMNSALDYHPQDSMGTIKADNMTLFGIISHKLTVKDALATGALKVTGDQSVMNKFMGVLDSNIPANFNLIQPRMN